MPIPFIKMHGAGNDFVVIDNRKSNLEIDGDNMRLISDRRFGIGCDQVVVLEKPEKHFKDAHVRMLIYNADGSESGACGNAARCVGWLMYNERAQWDLAPVMIQSADTVITAVVKDETTVTVDMGEPRLEWHEIPLKEQQNTLRLNIKKGELSDPSAVSMGNPHMVFFVPKVKDIELAVIGPQLEKHAQFPERANVSVAEINAKDKITLRVWERGSGETLACGTAACATLVAAHRRELTGRKALVKLPGGTLHIEWRDDNHVLMTGPVAVSFSGVIEL